MAGKYHFGDYMFSTRTKSSERQRLLSPGTCRYMYVSGNVNILWNFAYTSNEYYLLFIRWKEMRSARKYRSIYYVPTFNASTLIYLKTSTKNWLIFETSFHSNALREKCPNTEFFLVRIFPHSDWIRRYTSYLSAFSPNAGK